MQYLFSKEETRHWEFERVSFPSGKENLPILGRRSTSHAGHSYLVVHSAQAGESSSFTSHILGKRIRAKPEGVRSWLELGEMPREVLGSFCSSVHQLMDQLVYLPCHRYSHGQSLVVKMVVR